MGWRNYLPFGKKENPQPKTVASTPDKTSGGKPYSGNGDYTFLVRKVELEHVRIKTPVSYPIEFNEEQGFQHFRIRMKDLYEFCSELKQGQRFKRDDSVRYDHKKFNSFILPSFKRVRGLVGGKPAGEDLETLSEKDLIEGLSDLNLDSAPDLDLRADDSDSSDMGSGYDLKDDDPKGKK